MKKHANLEHDTRAELHAIKPRHLKALPIRSQRSQERAKPATPQISIIPTLDRPPGSVRVIAGTLRNSRIAVPNHPGLRPTPERVRETVFNWLTPMLPGARVLDLFAGTGVLGIEALSRGAQFVEFTDSDSALCEKLSSNLERLKINHQAKVTRGTMPVALSLSTVPADLVFIDPPFAAGLWHATLAALLKVNALKPRAMVYLEMPPEAELPAGWDTLKESRAAAVKFGLYRYAGV
jgi:16S rRNA (guanine966-N2)-methyltransferase